MTRVSVMLFLFHLLFGCYEVVRSLKNGPSDSIYVILPDTWTVISAVEEIGGCVGGYFSPPIGLWNKCTSNQNIPIMLNLC